MTPAESRPTVGRIVRSLRERAGHQRPWLADQCHISLSQLKNIENGHRLPNTRDLDRLEEVLGTGGLLKDLIACGDDDVRRRTILQSLALMGASVPGLVPVTPARTDTPQATTIRSMTASLRQLDNLHGGLQAHHSISGYLHNVCIPLLRTSSDGKGGNDLRTAVAELMLLTGWTAYDGGEHASAASYFRQAQSLATDSSDHALTGEVLAAMSHQAALLGRGGEAIQLADMALSSAVRSGMPALMAEAHMSAAHGAALEGDARMTARLLGRAARDLDSADQRNDPGWAGFLSTAYLDARTGHSLLASGDLVNAVENARSSLNMDPNYVRGKMFNLALLSTALLDAGQLDEGCGVGREALSLAEGISSARADEYLRRIALRLLPYRDHQQAGELVSAIGVRLTPLQHDSLESDDRG
ncbi:helix-turn-helix domain-containing protein [Glycomyces salinus]|uniref:helix-turn-helix domain-containing protein n=1 Tax=Glycomyces salinus TaxID=980294 RepID=UPI0018EE24F1|nr:helix-turn-helix transcriptional regulator [Glycomyces salinus]